MALKKAPYKGCRDFYPGDKRLRDYLFDKMRKVADQFGYEPYDGPLLEEVDLYKAKSGEELINEQIYSFTDRGDRHVAIRPEMTPTLARMIANIYRKAPLPIRWYAIPNLMRYERPQRGRLREHWQYNCDIFGAPGQRGSVEIMQLIVHLLNELGANDRHFEIRFNDRRIVDALFHELLKTDSETTYKLYKLIDRSKKITETQLEEELALLDLSDLQQEVFYRYSQAKSLDDILAIFKPSQLESRVAQTIDFTKQAEKAKLQSYLIFDPSIVRGLDYYTGLVFEVFDKHPDNRRALCGGGAYANLLQIFNEGPLEGVGFGLGDVTLKDFLLAHKLLPNTEQASIDILVTGQTEQAVSEVPMLAQQMRKQGLTAMTQLSVVKMAKVFTLAEKRGARSVILLGDHEIQQNSFEVKELLTRQQKRFTFSHAHTVKQWLDELKEIGSLD